MFNKIKIKIKNKNEILALVFLILITVTFTSYYNYTKTKIINNYNEIVNNIYFKKTTNHFFNQLEPKFKKIRHEIKEGETFDNILSQYLIDKKKIKSLKKKLLEKNNLNKLNTNQKIYLTLDQSINEIKTLYFRFQIKKEFY